MFSINQAYALLFSYNLTANIRLLLILHINKNIDIFSSNYNVLGKCVPNEGSGTPVQHSCLENSMDGGAWWATGHGVAKSRTGLSDSNFTLTFTHWRRKWQPTPVFLPGESQGPGSLVGCSLWGRTELDTTEAT